MTTTPAETITYPCPAEASPASGAGDVSDVNIPRILWAGIVLFSINAIIAMSIWVSPELRVNMYGAEQARVPAFRPSPFTEVVPMRAARKPRAPERVRPVVFQEQPAADGLVRETAYGLGEPSDPLPRVTSAALPAVSTGRFVHTSTVDVSSTPVLAN